LQSRLTTLVVIGIPLTTVLVVFLALVLTMLGVFSMIAIAWATDLILLIAKVLRGLLSHVVSPEKVDAAVSDSALHMPTLKGPCKPGANRRRPSSHRAATLH